MVVETVVKVVELKKHPVNAIPLAVILASVGVMLSMFFFSKFASVAMLFFVAIGASPILQDIFEDEVKEREKKYRFADVWKRNKRVLKLYFYVFIGLTITYGVGYLLAGANTEILFAEQLRLLTEPALFYSFPMMEFLQILANNILVLTCFFFLSFLYVTGSVLVLAWNASIFAVFLVNTAQQIAGGAVLLALPKVLFTYMFHALPEFFAFFLVAASGAVLSMSLIKKRHKTVGWTNIFTDVVVLLVLGYIMLIIAAIIEVSFARYMVMNWL